MKILLNDRRVNVTKANDDGKTPFYVACFRGHYDVVKELLVLGDDKIGVNQAEKRNNRTPFYIACRNGDMKIVELLLNSPKVEVNEVDKNKRTPFYIACERGHSKIVELLLSDERVARNIAQEDDDGWTAFDAACWKGQIEIVKLLKETKREEFKNPLKAHKLARKNGHTQIVDYLEKMDLQESKNPKFSDLWKAAIDNKIQEVERLLAENDFSKDLEETHVNGNPLLINTVLKDYYMVTKTLLDDGKVSLKKYFFFLSFFFLKKIFLLINLI